MKHFENFDKFRDMVASQSHGNQSIRTLSWSNKRVNRRVIKSDRDYDETGLRDLEPKNKANQTITKRYKNHSKAFQSASVTFSDYSIICTFCWSNIDLDITQTFVDYDEFMQSDFLKFLSYYFISDEGKTKQQIEEEDNLVFKLKNNKDFLKRYDTKYRGEYQDTYQYTIPSSDEEKLVAVDISVQESLLNEEQVKELYKKAIVKQLYMNPETCVDDVDEEDIDYNNDEFVDAVSELDNDISEVDIIKAFGRNCE